MPLVLLLFATTRTHCRINPAVFFYCSQVGELDWQNECTICKLGKDQEQEIEYYYDPVPE
jgi:hypothetical protein